MKGILGQIGATLIGLLGREHEPPPTSAPPDKPRITARNRPPVRRYGKQSGGSVRRALNLAGRSAFNEYRPFGSDEDHARAAGVGVGEYDELWRQNRNAAKARRQAIRRAA